MLIEEKMSLTHSYKNPFEEINANVLDFKRLVEYWCSPFQHGVLTSFNEHQFRTSEIPIIVQGSRGSGKTTLLKYFSFPAQIERAEIMGYNSLSSMIAEEKEVGFYYRCEDSFIGTFSAVFKRISKDYWINIFKSYLELVFSEKVLEMLEVLIIHDGLEDIADRIANNIDSGSCGLDFSKCDSIRELITVIKNELYYYETFKNKAVFTNEQFAPSCIIDIFSISQIIINTIKENYVSFKDTLFVIMIDEFENLPIELQECINTIIKFVKSGVSIRVGRRSEGNNTTRTINDSEYLRENHDYYLASLDAEMNLEEENKAFKNYFLEIANRRLEYMQSNKANPVTISVQDMLGDMEDLDDECKGICGTRKKHVDVVLRQSSMLSGDKERREAIIDIIKNDTNPIAETLNALWVIRSKDSPEDAACKAVCAMNGYFSKNTKVEGYSKYKDDYSNKYRYAITTCICSIYKKPKLYYGFNTICYLANGNTRAFINICREIINEAEFYEQESFHNNNTVSKDVQSRAIHNYSRAEFDSICSIIDSGNLINNLVSNIGNSLREFHADKKIRYPETTQFSFDYNQLQEDDASVVRIAESWAIIKRRLQSQRASAGLNTRTDLYHINRLFHPIFNISYRTRGGVNLTLSAVDMNNMINNDSYYPSSVNKLISSQVVSQEIVDESKQMSFFDMEVDDE